MRRPGTLRAAPRQLSDTSDSGSFENASGGTLNVTLSDATQLVTLSPGAVDNDGTINANLGILALDGAGTHGGSFAGAVSDRSLLGRYPDARVPVRAPRSATSK